MLDTKSVQTKVADFTLQFEGYFVKPKATVKDIFATIETIEVFKFRVKMSFVFNLTYSLLLGNFSCSVYVSRFVVINLDVINQLYMFWPPYFFICIAQKWKVAYKYLFLNDYLNDKRLEVVMDRWEMHLLSGEPFFFFFFLPTNT